MKWNWQHSKWPAFRYDAEAMRPLESTFLQSSGFLLASVQHLDTDTQAHITVEFISEEALKTSEIEGEHLNRESVQSSVRKQFGLQVDNKGHIPVAERGIAEMMVDVYKKFDQPLTDQTLFRWHKHLLAGSKDLREIGHYRTSEEPMQIVSGAIDAPKIHFVAPPSHQVPHEMKAYLQWYTNSSDMPALTRAGIAHIYFLAIHPFMDGNGRIARALSEKLLAEAIGHPTLLAMAKTIEADRKNYYKAIQSTNHQLEIDGWLQHFAQSVLRAQETSLRKIEFLIHKGKLLDRLEDQLNPRQKKALQRLFKAGPDGFQGGLSAENYISMTNASRATATRDLQDLVTKNALKRTGERKHTRYWLTIG